MDTVHVVNPSMLSTPVEPSQGLRNQLKLMVFFIAKAAAPVLVTWLGPVFLVHR